MKRAGRWVSMRPALNTLGLRAVDALAGLTRDLAPELVVVVRSTMWAYRWMPASILEHDGINVIEPEATAT